MIVSHAHRFVFIRTRKTAGTSIEIALYPVTGPDDVVAPVTDQRDQAYFDEPLPARNAESIDVASAAMQHLNAGGVIERIGHAVWDDYLTFAVDRNPWDRAVSQYVYAISHPDTQRLPFAEWLRSVPVDRLSNFHLYSVDGEVAVKRLIRYESLLADLTVLCRELGLPTLDMPWAKSQYRTSMSRDWRPMYDASSAAYISSLCHREIELLGYTFDDLPAPEPSAVEIGADPDHRPAIRLRGPRGGASRSTPPPTPVALDGPTRYRFPTQAVPEYVFPGEVEEDLLRGLERSHAFAWSPNLDVSSLGARLQRSGFIGPATSNEAWIFDHIPKTGGSEFAASADRRLYAHDHLNVRWTASWFAIVLGRLERASLVHGHGAPFAEHLAPHRNWRTAVCVRDPVELTVSTFQQYARDRALRGLSAVALEDWLESEVAKPRSAQSLNVQVYWLGRVRVPSMSLPHGVPQRRESVESVTARALDRLDRCDLVGTPETVNVLFERVSRSAMLRIRADDGRRRPPANSSLIRSRVLAASLPSHLREALYEITKPDRILFEHAATHPGRVF